MDSGILRALANDPVIRRLTAGRAQSPSPALPRSMVAKVISLKGDLAVLQREEGTLTASLNARVTPGEVLMLRYSGRREELPHYRIMARLPAGEDTGPTASRGSGEPVLLGFLPGQAGGSGSLPTLLRFKPDRQSSEGSDPAKPEPLLEMFLDTDSFGLVLIQFYYFRDNRLQCRFTVESESAGRALEKEAGRLVAEAAGSGAAETGEPLQWSVGDLRRVTAEALHQGGLQMDRRA